jgi:N-methylhydantoinase B
VNPFEASQPVSEDDAILSLNCGGGGVGDPLDREPARVVADLEMNIFSMEMAREIFGVIVDPVTGAVDEKATAIRREEIRARRRERGKVWEGSER